MHVKKKKYIYIDSPKAKNTKINEHSSFGLIRENIIIKNLGKECN